MAIKDNKIPSPQSIKSLPQSFSEQELNEIKELRNQISTLTFQIGQNAINKIKLEEQESLFKDQLKSIEEKETLLAKRFTDKYGKGSIDLETGTFTPLK